MASVTVADSFVNLDRLVFWRRPKRRRHTDRLDTPATRIAAGFRFQGDIRGEEGCRVAGEIIGDGKFDGTVILAEGGSWLGEIVADYVCIGGRFDGHVEARAKLELLATAVVSGNLKCPVIAIAEGAVVEGTISRPQKTRITRYTERRGTGTANRQAEPENGREIDRD